MGKPCDVTGLTFGYLEALRPTEERDGRTIVWECRCKCSKIVKVPVNRLNNGSTKSCGCFRVESTIKRSRTHGASRSTSIEGAKQLDYVVWCGIKERCYDINHKSYDRYGGRGITMCKFWRKHFTAFAKYIRTLANCPSEELLISRLKGRRLKVSIDRINTDGNYEPGNLKWSTPKEQSNNKSNNKSNNVIITYKNKKMTLMQAVEIYGVVSYSVVHDRLNRYKWSLDKSLTTPLRGKNG